MNDKILRCAIRCLLKEIRRRKRNRSKRAEEVVTPAESFPQTFVMESFFAIDLIRSLTPGANEEMHFLTGPKLGPIRIVSRRATAPQLDKQSPVFVRASA